MAFNYSPKPVIDSSLVLYLDAANPKSYVSGSTRWTDVSRGGNSGTLINMGNTGYTSSNGGSLVFDGTNDYVLMTNKPTPTQFSILSWVNIGNVNSGYRTIYADNVKGLWLNNRVINYYPVHTGLNTLNINQWYLITITYNGSLVISYINGILDKSVNATTGLPSTVSTSIGGHDNIEFFNGNISNVQIYNRALSAAEVLQNYNALKGRYNLR
jgi:hypothetical protein